MKKNYLYALKIMFFMLVWKAFLLISAVAEYDKTDFSRALIARYEEVPEMLESILMGLVIFLIGCYAYSYMFCKKEEKQ